MIQLKVNGSARKFDGDPEMPLLWYLRDVLNYTGTKFGCGAGLCGACTVHVNGEAIRSCVTTMKDAAGKWTILRPHNHTHPFIQIILSLGATATPSRRILLHVCQLFLDSSECHY